MQKVKYLDHLRFCPDMFIDIRNRENEKQFN